MQQNNQAPQLLTVEREILAKERATLIDRLTFVERRLGIESSIRPKRERQLEQRPRVVERHDRS